ncbi:Lcl C-terminal domain-containing protein [Nitrospina gracilis]|uniref:Lcl C-terminal domain-containing protein n=1 Tax=Nitrospina gracilis TaxID=35801 RepID=UPI001F416D96|nr:DUF1566 domain-containing protein [Nitrospina gracilis]MCF8721368.1 hypothetical protein [Nitrospina gracilis Nb-211]
MAETKTKVRFVDNGDGTVTDTRKNRMWLKDDSWVEKGHLISWWQSQEFLQEKNEQKFAGYQDWRIPNAHEAKELYDPELSNTDMEGCEVHIDPVFTSGCGYTTWTTETRGAKAAMGYDFRADYEYWLAKENIGFPSAVRLVRIVGDENKMPDEERYADNGNGTITDQEMKLMWKKDDSYLDLDKWVSWDEAKTFVLELNKEEFAGHTDWRMPTRKEAQSIHRPGNPVTDTYGDTLYIPSIFSPGAGQTSWTKTLHKTDPTVAIRFNYFSGDYKFHKKGLRSHGVRPVRDLKEEDQ